LCNTLICTKDVLFKEQLEKMNLIHTSLIRFA
jgi:hypothetical protein